MDPYGDLSHSNEANKRKKRRTARGKRAGQKHRNDSLSLNHDDDDDYNGDNDESSARVRAAATSRSLAPLPFDQRFRPSQAYLDSLARPNQGDVHASPSTSTAIAGASSSSSLLSSFPVLSSSALPSSPPIQLAPIEILGDSSDNDDDDDDDAVGELVWRTLLRQPDSIVLDSTPSRPPAAAPSAAPPPPAREIRHKVDVESDQATSSSSRHASDPEEFKEEDSTGNIDSDDDDDDMVIYDAIAGTAYHPIRGELDPAELEHRRFLEIIDLVDLSDGESYVFDSSDDDGSDIVIMDQYLFPDGTRDELASTERQIVATQPCDPAEQGSSEELARLRALALASRLKGSKSQSPDDSAPVDEPPTSSRPATGPSAISIMLPHLRPPVGASLASRISDRFNQEALSSSPPRADTSHAYNVYSSRLRSPSPLPNRDLPRAIGAITARAVRIPGTAEEVTLSTLIGSAVLTETSHATANETKVDSETGIRVDPATGKGVYIRPPGAPPPSATNPLGANHSRIKGKKKLRPIRDPTFLPSGPSTLAPPSLDRTASERRSSVHKKLRAMFSCEVGPVLQEGSFSPAWHVVPCDEATNQPPPRETIQYGFWPGPSRPQGAVVAPSSPSSSASETISTTAGGSISRPRIDIFIDNSNVRNSFTNWLSETYPPPAPTNGSRPIMDVVEGQRIMFDYEMLFAVLERGMGAKIGRRVLVGSSRLKQGVIEAIRWGYEVSILQRVPRRSVVLPSDPSLPAPPPITAYREQAVDEVLHLKILESLLDYTPPPVRPPFLRPPPSHRPLLILVSGDARPSEYNPHGFLGCVRRALRLGWDVEIWAFQKASNRAWNELRARQGTKTGEDGEGEVRIVDLSTFGADLARTEMPSTRA